MMKGSIFYRTKKSHLVAFIFAASLVLFSCTQTSSPIISVTEKVQPETEKKQVVKVLFLIELPKEFEEQFPMKSSKPSSSRTVLPDLGDTEIIYKAELDGTDIGEVQKEFSKKMSTGEHTLSITGSVGGSAILLGETKINVSVTVSKDPVKIILGVNKNNTDKGTLSLPIEWDADTGVDTIKYKIQGDADFTTLTSGSKAITRDDVPMGSYEVIILFLKGDTLCYSVQTAANVFANCTTKVWRDENGVTGGKLHVTSTLVNSYQNFTFFVNSAATGEENGSYYNPYKKLQTAIDAVCGKTNGTSQYYIYVSGDCTAAANTPLADFGSFSKKLNLSIIGVGSGDTPTLSGNGSSIINANGNGTLNLYLKNFNLKDGASILGGGGILFYMDSDSTLSLEDVTLTDCTARNQGGGIYFKSKMLSLKNTTIEGCTLTDSGSPHIGSAIYSEGDMVFDGKTKVSNKCDVYLADEKAITLADGFSFTAAGNYKRAAKITPENFAEGKLILSGAKVQSKYIDFATSIGYWKINKDGELYISYPPEVYLSCESPYDIEEGTEDDPAKSLEVAMTLLDPNGTTPKIVIVNPYTLSEDEFALMDFSEKSALTMRRGAGCSGDMIKVDASKLAKNIDFTVANITLDGNKSLATSNTSPTLNIVSTSTYKANVTLKDVTVQNNGGYGINVSSYSTLMMKSGAVKNNNSHGIYNLGTFILNGGEISGNKPASSGTVYGIYNYGSYSSRATLTVEEKGGESIYIKDNGSNGIYNYDYSDTTIKSGEISGNGTIGNNKCGVYNYSGSTLNVDGGIIKGGSNYGIYAYGGTVKVTGGEVSGGSGIYNSSGNVTISGSASVSGTSGVNASGSGTTVVEGGSVSGSQYGINMSGSSATVTLKGGEISGTYYGVYYNSGTALNMQDAATVQNGIYLATNREITITGTLNTTSAGDVATIIPQKYQKEITVISIGASSGIAGNELENIVELFTLEPNPSGESWIINKLGALALSTNSNTIYVDPNIVENGNTDGKTKDTAFSTLNKAVVELKDQTDSPTVIFVRPYTLKAGEETLLDLSLSDYPSGISFKRCYDSVDTANSCIGDLLIIDSGVTSSDAAPIVINNITFDGIKNAVTNATGSLIKVESGAYVKLSDGVVVQNNKAVGIINAGNLTIDGATITGNTGNGIANTGTLTVDNADTEISKNAYGIHNSGSTAKTTINNGKITQNTSGGVYNTGSGSKVIMEGGYITENNGTNGAGVYNAATFELNGGSISDNTATSNGGGVYNYSSYYSSSATFTAKGGTISGNKAQNGAGIYIYGGTITIKDDTEHPGVSPVIETNTATTNGGGIFVDSGTLNLSGGKISSNRAVNGGGIYNNSTFNLSGGTITVNNATYGGGIYNKSTLTISGGTIISNSVNPPNGNGSGIYNAATLNMRDDAIIDPSNNLYLDNSSATRYITITGAINGTGTIASIMMASYTNSYTQVLYSSKSGSSGVEIDQALCDRFKLSDASYYIEASRSGSYSYYGNLAKLGIYYVCGTGSTYFSVSGDDVNGNGSRTNPFATVQKAIDRINAINDGESEYKIYVDGTFQNTNTSILLDFTNIKSDANVSIIGLGSSKAILKGKENRVIYALDINKTYNISLENLIIQNGSTGGNGAGIEYGPKVGSVLKITGCEFKDNVSSSGNGGAIDLIRGTLKISDTSFNNNSANSKAGAINVQSSAAIEMSGNMQFVKTSDNVYLPKDVSIKITGGLNSTSSCRLTLQEASYVEKTVILEADTDSLIASNYEKFILNDKSDNTKVCADFKIEPDTVTPTQAILIKPSLSGGITVTGPTGYSFSLSQTTATRAAVSAGTLELSFTAAANGGGTLPSGASYKIELLQNGSAIASADSNKLTVPSWMPVGNYEIYMNISVNDIQLDCATAAFTVTAE